MKSLTKKREFQEKKKKLQQYCYWSFIAFIVFYTLFLARFNIIHYWQTKSANRQLRESLIKFTLENENLRKQIEDLRHNPEAWERIAREKYGMQKKGERVILFQEVQE